METADAVAALVDLALRSEDVEAALRSGSFAVDDSWYVVVDEKLYEAIEAKDVDRAFASAWVRNLVAAHLGNEGERMVSQLRLVWLQTLIGRELEEYDAARQLALQVNHAAAEPWPAVAADAAALAAEAAYFASTSVADAASRAEWLLRALRDLHAFTSGFSPWSTSGRFNNTVSLIGQVATEIGESPLAGEEEQAEREGLLAGLADAVEVQVPLNFAPPDEGRFTSLAIDLASLSYHHGRRAAAVARLEAALAVVHHPPEVLALSNALYGAAPLPALRARMRAILSALRAETQSPLARLMSAQDADEVGGTLLLDDLASGVDPVEVVRASELSRARLLLDYLEWPPAPFPDEALRAVVSEREQEVLSWDVPADADDVHFEMALASRLPVVATGDDGARVQTAREIERVYTDAGAGFGHQAEPSEAGELSAAVREGEVVVAYIAPFQQFHPAEEVWAVAVTSDRVLRLRCPVHLLPTPSFVGRLTVDDQAPVDLSPLSSLITSTRLHISAGDDASADAGLRLLHEALMQPLASHGIRLEEFDRCVIVPHGALHLVPWNALIDRNGRRTIEHTAVSVAPSASVWHRLQARPNEAPTSALTVGCGDPVSGLPVLRDADREAAEVARRLSVADTLVLTGDAATSTAFRAGVAGRSIVHVAAHGEFPQRNPVDFHRFRLRGAGDEGVIRAADVRALDLRAASLVVLSICNGGVIRSGPGDEPYGLVPAVLAAGANNVLATQWAVEDSWAREFTTTVAARLLELGPAAAVAEATRLWIDQTPLKNWAAFALVGPGRQYEEALTGRQSSG